MGCISVLRNGLESAYSLYSFIWWSSGRKVPTNSIGYPASEQQKGAKTMSWRKPTVTRIAVGCEINAYGCAVV